MLRIPAFDNEVGESLDITVYYDVSDGVGAPVAQTAAIALLAQMIYRQLIQIY